MTESRRVGRRGGPIVVWIVGFALAALSLVGWSFASAPGSSPDDDFHVASIWCGLGEREGLCEQAPIAEQRLIPAGVLAATCHARVVDASAACLVLEDPHQMVPTDRGNFQGLYPPVYYAVAGLFVGPDIWASIAGIRILNSAIFLAFIGALLWLGPRWLRAPAVLVPIVTAVPLGAFLIASVNPSSWAITSAIAVTTAMILIPKSDGRRRIGLAIVAVLGAFLGAGARADAAIFAVLAVVVGLVLGLRRDRSSLWLLGTGVIITIISVLFYLSASQSNAATEGLNGTPPESAGSFIALFTINVFQIPDLWAGVFGRWALGWFDVPMQGLVWVAGLAVFAVTVFFGLGRMTVRKGVALALAFAAMWGYPLLLQIQSQTVVGTYVQPRYVLPLLMMVAIIALTDERTATALPTHTATQRWFVIVALGLANSVALFAVVRRYAVGNAGGASLDSPDGWWWTTSPLWSPTVVWVTGSVAFLALLTWTLRRTPPSPAAVDVPLPLRAGQ